MGDEIPLGKGPMHFAFGNNLTDTKQLSGEPPLPCGPLFLGCFVVNIPQIRVGRESGFVSGSFG